MRQLAGSGRVPLAVATAVDLDMLPELSSHDIDSAKSSTEPERYNRMDVFSIYTPIFIAYSSFSAFPFGTRGGPVDRAQSVYFFLNPMTLPNPI